MFVITKKNLILIFSSVILVTILCMSVGGKMLETTAVPSRSNIIVIDAGHGLPDGGATANGVTESGINLKIAEKVEEQLLDLGYEVVMTREDENNIADSNKQSPINAMKQSDLNNRVKIINESGADICISIHLNKYDVAKYWGWQTFYSENSSDGKRLAELIQTEIGNCIDKDNTRQSLKISNIRIVDKTNIPVVIVECGFISNTEEAALLQDEDYQEKLAQGICEGIQRYYNE